MRTWVVPLLKLRLPKLWSDNHNLLSTILFLTVWWSSAPPEPSNHDTITCYRSACLPGECSKHKQYMMRFALPDTSMTEIKITCLSDQKHGWRFWYWTFSPFKEEWRKLKAAVISTNDAPHSRTHIWLLAWSGRWCTGASHSWEQWNEFLAVLEGVEGVQDRGRGEQCGPAVWMWCDPGLGGTAGSVPLAARPFQAAAGSWLIEAALHRVMSPSNVWIRHVKSSSPDCWSAVGLHQCLTAEKTWLISVISET